MGSTQWVVLSGEYSEELVVIVTDDPTSDIRSKEHLDQKTKKERKKP